MAWSGISIWKWSRMLEKLGYRGRREKLRPLDNEKIPFLSRLMNERMNEGKKRRTISGSGFYISMCVFIRVCVSTYFFIHFFHLRLTATDAGYFQRDDSPKSTDHWWVTEVRIYRQLHIYRVPCVYCFKESNLLAFWWTIQLLCLRPSRRDHRPSVRIATND